MKNLILILLLFIQPVFAFSQTKNDFTNVVYKFIGYYNRAQSDSICRMFDDYDTDPHCLFPPDYLKTVIAKYGKIRTFNYVGIDTISDHNRITLFKIRSDKKTFMLGLTLEKNNKLGTFRFNTSSPYIDSLLKKN